MQNSSFIADARWDDWINEGAAILYDLQIAAYGEDYFMADPVEFNTVSGTDLYSFSTIGITDFYKLAGVDFVLGPNNVKTLKPFTFHDRNRGTGAFAWTAYNYLGIRYRLRGSKLWFAPAPLGAYTIRVHYVPVFTKMDDDADTFEAQNNWETYIINYAARKALIKEESDVSEIERDMQRLEDHVESMAANRDIGEEMPATDVNRMYDESDYLDIY